MLKNWYPEDPPKLEGLKDWAAKEAESAVLETFSSASFRLSRTDDGELAIEFVAKNWEVEVEIDGRAGTDCLLRTARIEDLIAEDVGFWDDDALDVLEALVVKLRAKAGGAP